MDELGPSVAGFRHSSIDSAAAGSVTVADVLQGLGAESLSGQDTIIFRPDTATSADNYRRAGTLTTASGLLAHTGADYADTTTTNEVIEFWLHGVRFDKDVLPTINRSLEDVNFDTFFPISHMGDLDGDMFVSTDTDWTNVGTPTTSEKDTTARRTPYGVRNYHLVNDAANEGTQSATVGGIAGRLVSMFAIASCNAGTASLRGYDVTNGADFDLAAVTSSEEEPVFLFYRNAEVPASCTEIAARMLGTTSSSDVYWNGLWLYKHDNLRVDLPSYINERFKAPRIFEARPRVSTADDVYPAGSLEFVPLREKVDYFYVTAHNDANPHAIMMADGWAYNYPLYVQARLPYSEMGALSADTDTTTAPLHLVVPRIKLELLNNLYQFKLPEARYRRLIAQALNERSRAEAARSTTEAGPSKPHFAGVAQA